MFTSNQTLSKHILSYLYTTILILTLSTLSVYASEVDEYESTVTISPTSVTITEGDSGQKSVDITITLDQCPEYSDIKLRYYTSNGSANTGDYVSTSGNIIFQKNGSNCSHTITVQIKGDTTREDNQRFYLNFRDNGTHSLQGIEWSNGRRATITIENDDLEADLRMQKYSMNPVNNNTSWTRDYDVGDAIGYKLVGTNRGPDPSRITITDPLPPGFQITSVSDNSSNFSCTTSGQTVNCTGSRVFTKDQQVEVYIKGIAQTAGTYSNTATIDSPDNIRDQAPWNNSSTRVVYVGAPGGESRPLIDKNVDNYSPAVGDVVTFTLTITNQGFDKQLVIRDRLPANYQWGTTGGAFEFYPSASNPNLTYPGNVTCRIQSATTTSPYLECWSNNEMGHLESFEVTFQAKVLTSNGRAEDGYAICNRVHGYNYWWTWLRSDRICLNARSANPPTLAPLPDQSSQVGETVNIDLSSYAHDIDGDAIQFSASNLPPGLNMNVNGIITGEPSDSGSNTYTVTVYVTDVPRGGVAPVTVSTTFEYTITYPSVQAYPNHYTMEANSTLSGNIIIDTDATNTNADTGYNIQVTDNDSIPTTQGMLTVSANGDFTFTPESTFLGTVTFDYEITDSEGSTSEATVTIEVSTDYEDGFQPFELINPPDTRNVLGNFAIAGNTVECISDSQSNFNGTCTDNSALLSNDYVTKYIDIDSDPSTWNSSSSYITLPNSYDHANKGVLWAGLFWQGRYTSDAVAPNGTDKIIRYGVEGAGSFTYDTSISPSDINNIAGFNANKIKLKINAGNSYDGSAPYRDITALTLYSNRNDGGVSYAAFADVTTLLQSELTQKGDYTFTVANLGTAEGWENNPGLYGGWSLVVIYAEDFTGKVRNVAIFSGYDQIDASNKPETIIPVSGFKLPAANQINSTLGIFSGEGEYPLGNSAGDYDRVKLSPDGVIYSYPNPLDPQKDNVFDAILSNIDREHINGKFNTLTSNNTGVDIDFLNVSELMQNYRDNFDPNINSVYIKMETNKDIINPSMLVFATELYVPKLCYDYAYSQYGVSFREENNGSKPARIIGDNITTGEPITVELLIRNNEQSDAILNNLELNIFDINDTQAPRITDSTYIIEAGESKKKHIPDSIINATPYQILDIPLGDIDAQDYIYSYYDIMPQQSSLNMPINASVDFTLNLLGGITYDLTVFLSSMELCSTNISYDIEPGPFNVEDMALTDTHYYDLPTQITRRVGKYVVRAYDANQTDQRKNISTMVAIDLVDADKFGDSDNACQQSSNTLSPRVWVTFENNSSITDFTRDTIDDAINAHLTSDIILGNQQMTDPEDFYSLARKSVAFRISANEHNGSIILLESQSGGGYKVLNFPDYSSENLGNGVGYCAQNIGGSPTTFTSQCSAAVSGTTMSKAALASCMECIFGVQVARTCSRDNFAMRPKGFRVTLSDQSQTDSSLSSVPIGINSNTIPMREIVSGYNYLLDMNTTDFKDSNNPTPGYINHFNSNLPDPDRVYSFSWDDANNPTTCNNTNDINQSASFINGISTENNLSNDEVGRYLLSLLDREYTKHDWKEEYMQHQQGSNHFYPGRDCVANDATAQEEDVPTAVSSPHLSSVNGCNISTNVTGDNGYIDMPLRIHPYTFDMGGLNVIAGTNVNKAFVYINNAPNNTREDLNMSYNFNGTYFASGFNGARATNFTTGCRAEDTNMLLSFDYLSPVPANEPFLTYSLRDINTSNTALIYRPAGGGTVGFERNPHSSTNTPFIIGQTRNFYADDMLGSITMNLGYNFQRTMNTPLNPRFINFRDFNITYRTNPTEVFADLSNNYIIRGNRVLDQNVSFVYGRAKPSQFLYDNITANFAMTPISTLMYCDLPIAQCQNRGLPAIVNGLLQDARSNEAAWWFVERHNEMDDGNVRIATPNNGNITLDFANGIDESIRVDNDLGNPTPNIVDVNLTIDNTLGAGNFTNRWLIFNADANATPVPFYRVRFIDQGVWTGAGQTGHVVGDRVNTKKTRRLEY